MSIISDLQTTISHDHPAPNLLFLSHTTLGAPLAQPLGTHWVVGVFGLADDGHNRAAVRDALPHAHARISGRGRFLELRPHGRGVRGIFHDLEF